MAEISAEIRECRVCGENSLVELLNLGELALTGVFLANGKDVPKEPLVLVRCAECGLVQLKHNYLKSALFNDSYGYESHLNSSMVQHLHRKARLIEKTFLDSSRTPIAVDIASNDGTFLNGYKREEVVKVGIDPLIDVFSDYYPETCIRIPKFFSAEAYWERLGEHADVVTSLSVIYDLEDPVSFAQQVSSILKEEGIWHFEQSYLPSMLATNSFDTICHEHLLYLSLSDIVRILTSAGLQIIDASLNSTNGGSVAVTAIKSRYAVRPSLFVKYLLQAELEMGILSGERVIEFSFEVNNHIAKLKNLILSYKDLGYRIHGLGASTKGNVILQAADLDGLVVNSIGEINPRKFGLQTPGSCIEIVEESSMLSEISQRTLLIVLPWHFRENLLPKIENAIRPGNCLALFPLPQLEVVSV